MANKMVGRFTIDFVNKQIIGTKASFKKAGTGKGEIYNELAAKIAVHPDFALTVKEQKHRSNKVKQTYDGLNFPLMEQYIAIHENAESILKEYHAAKKMAKDIGSSAYPFVKKWFLDKFKNFDVASARTAISDYNMKQVPAMALVSETELDKAS